MKIIVICLLLLSASFAGVARLDTLPSNFQLYPRDQSDSGSVVIKGVVLETGHDSLIVLVKRNGALLLSVKVPLTYTGDSVSFRYVYRIRAELAEYSFEMKVDDVSILSVNNVVSGDAFVVSGQSNAVAFPGGWAQEYVRSYVNSRWVGDTGAAGAWEQELGALIAARTGIPVAIINGAESATGITEQLCNPTNHRDAGTMYGRLLNRVINAGLQNKVRAMFYYQGENNTNRLSGSVGYAGYFNTLRSAWHEDYPALEKIYVCQINMWNPLYEVSEAPSLIRDIQRKFQHDYSDIATIATVGTPGYDGGHYTLIGYNMLGRSMFPLIERDLYYKAGIDTANVSSPDIVHASYTTAARDRISLRFDQPVYWTESDGKGHYMKDYFALDGVYKVVDSGWNSEDGRTIELKLKTSSTAAAITYLHNTNAYHNESGIFIEPVLRNSRKIAALTFYQFPISLDTATVNSIAFTLMADTVEQYDTVSVSLSGAVPGVVFTSLDPFVAAVSIDGLVTGKNIGVARIVASKQNYKDTLVLHVISGTAICKGLSFVSDKKQVLIDSLFSPEVVAVFEKGGRRFSAIVDSLCIWHYNSGYFAKSNGKIKGLIAGMEIPLVASLSGFTDTLYVDMYMYPSIVKRINLQTQYEPIKKIDGWINDSAGLYRTGRGYGWILDDANNVVFGGNLASPAHTYLANTMVWPRFEELRYRIDVPAGNYQLLLCNVNSNVKPAHFVIFNGDTLIKNKPERDRGCWTTSRVTVSGDSGLHFYLHGALSYLVLISDDGAPLSMVANDSSFGVITAPPSTPYEEEKSNVLLTRVVKATPNPFNPITKISFNAAANEAGVYSVYNMRGQLIRSFIFKNRENGPALITFTWDSRDKFGRNIASGIYTGILKTKGRKFTHTMVLVR